MASAVFMLNCLFYNAFSYMGWILASQFFPLKAVHKLQIAPEDPLSMHTIHPMD